MGNQYAQTPVITRFGQQINKTSTCWLWTGHLDADGYGKIKVQGKTIRVHRFSYERHIGPIPDGLEIDHLCRVRNCVNPGHLEPVTTKENQSRGVSARTHCKRGHRFTLENTKYYPDNRRGCRTCMRDYDRRYKREARRIAKTIQEGRQS